EDVRLLVIRRAAEMDHRMRLHRSRNRGAGVHSRQAQRYPGAAKRGTGKRAHDSLLGRTGGGSGKGTTTEWSSAPCSGGRPVRQLAVVSVAPPWRPNIGQTGYFRRRRAVSSARLWT